MSFARIATRPRTAEGTHQDRLRRPSDRLRRLLTEPRPGLGFCAYRVRGRTGQSGIWRRGKCRAWRENLYSNGVHSDDADATIVISRKHGGWRDWLRSYGIMVDTNLVGKIKRGQRVELPVSHGQHELFLKIDWCTSRSITFDVQPGAVVEFFCEPGGPATAGMRTVLGDTGQYITLTRADSHTP